MFISQNVSVLGHCLMWVSTWRHRQLLCSGSCEKIDSYGGQFTADSRSHGRHVDEGARLSELLVAVIIVAPDGGKWTYSTLVNECLNIQVDS